MPVPSIKDVFYEVERRRVEFGVVPIENSTEGVVNHTLDMFVDSNLHIVAEREEPISHALLSISGKLGKTGEARLLVPARRRPSAGSGWTRTCPA